MLVGFSQFCFCCIKFADAIDSLIMAILGSLINLQNNLMFVQFIVSAAIDIFLFVHLKITEKLPFFSFRVMGSFFSDFLEVVGRSELLSAFQ